MKTPPLPSLRQVVPLLALVSLAFALTACSRSTSVPCSAELACPDGWKCSADGQTCIQNLCGDGVIQLGEACDDGNTNSDDGCNSTCSSNEQCGNGYLDTEKDEKCDDGNTSSDDDCLSTCKIAMCGDGVVSSKSVAEEECDYGDRSTPCNLDCTAPQCGDGRVTASTGEECDNGSRENSAKCNWNCTVPTCGDSLVNPAAGEECDDGNEDEDDACLSTCKRSTCGDGYRNPATEACDDGNTVEELRCDYGTQSCGNFCKADCSGLLRLKGSFCGDGVIDASEACDDGNTVEENACPRGTWSCSPCNADCSAILDLSGPVCGNGIREWGEACDDGNTESCGSCNSYCTSVVSETRARGSIKAIKASDLIDGETLTISDGLHGPLVLEFNKTGGTSTGHIPLSIDDSHTAENVAGIIRDVIKAMPQSILEMNATVSGSTVKLESAWTGDIGNQKLLETVSNPGFSVTNMTGGKPYACSEGVGCVKDSDCTSGFACVNKQCAEL